MEGLEELLWRTGRLDFTAGDEAAAERVGEAGTVVAVQRGADGWQFVFCAGTPAEIAAEIELREEYGFGSRGFDMGEVPLEFVEFDEPVPWVLLRYVGGGIHDGKEMWLPAAALLVGVHTRVADEGFVYVAAEAWSGRRAAARVHYVGRV